MTLKTQKINLKNRKKYVVIELQLWIFKLSIYNGCKRLNIRFNIDIGKKW